MQNPNAAPAAHISDVEFKVNVNPLLLIALLSAIVFHGGLSLYGTYANTYDAYVHIFFADHWTRSWFDHWDTRWYTGFPLISYPPLSQQSVALVSFLTHDLQLAFAFVQTTSITVMTLGMYRFAKLWVSEEAAGWAAIWLVFSTAMAETIHVFGQLPTTFSLGLLLNALPFAYAWVERGRLSDLIKAWALMAATTGGHHVTTLFGSVFITAPVILLALLQRFRTPLPDEPTGRPKLVNAANWRALIVRRLRRVLTPTIRAGVFGVGTIVLLVLVVFPYWYWSKTDPITQVSIPHASRDNFLVNLNAGLVFWLIPYGLLLFTFPYVFYKGLTTKAWPLTASIALLALLGTGGTTPIPKLLLRGAFDILTLDRFTLWASILMLPLAGEFVVSLRHRGLARWIDEQFGRVTLRALQIALAVGLLVAAIFTVSLTQFRRFQPDPINMQPIVNFINKDEHWRWRYLTLGFGDQMAWLSAQTTAAQVDGNYHSARRLPELTTTPVERLEGAKFRGIPGIGSLQQFLAVPDKFNLKFVYSNDQFYDPLLYFYGWHRLQRLENGIVVWERADIPALPEVLPRREIPLVQRWMFGLLPPFALIAAVTVTTARWWGLPLLLLAEFLGLGALLRRLPRPRRTPPQRLWNWADSRLAQWSDLPAQDSTPFAPWQVWLRYFTMFSLKRMKPASPRARHVRAAMLLMLLLVAAGATAFLLRRAASDPIRVVEAYYDDLDFRRFEAAYARLNPNTRPPFDQYLLQLSVQGGLVASYGKLDGLTTEILAEEPDYLSVQARATLITALDYYTDTVTHELSRVDGQWFIEPAPVDVSQPPGEFIRQPTLDWLAMNTRRIGIEGDDLENPLDRPELEILSARLVRDSQGAFSVVGELQNRDTNPADTTLSATIYDSHGNELVWYNASEVMLHKLFPQEITPFRVDFEGVAGDTLESAAANFEFDPDQRWAYSLPRTAEIGRFSAFGRAIATDRDLLRDVAAQDITFVADTTVTTPTLRLRGQLINNGVIEAIVPHLLITLYDADGNVRWVDHHYLRESIRPQRSVSVDIPLTPAAATRLLSVGGSAYPGSTDNTLGPRPDFIPLPAGFGYAYARLSVHYQPKSE